MKFGVCKWWQKDVIFVILWSLMMKPWNFQIPYELETTLEQNMNKTFVKKCLFYFIQESNLGPVSYSAFSPCIYLDKSFWGCALQAGFQPPEWPDLGQCSLLPQCFLLFCFLNELNFFLKSQPALLRQRMFLPDWFIAWFWFTLHLLVPPLALILKSYLKCTSLHWSMLIACIACFLNTF